MSETSSNPAAGPALPEEVEEVQGIFPSDAALQTAIDKLERHGFHRAELSLPIARPDSSDNNPSAGAENPNTEDDARQTRTLHASMAGSTAALLAGGIVVMASGGAALVPAGIAAAAAGLGVGGAGAMLSTAANRAEHELREEAAAAGQLVLAVHVSDPAQFPVVEQAMEEAGATKIARVVRASPSAVDSSAWTGA